MRLVGVPAETCPSDSASLTQRIDQYSATSVDRKLTATKMKLRIISGRCFVSRFRRLKAGRVEGGILTCPHHEFQYDLTGGERLTAFEVKLRSHAVRVIGGRVEVKLET